MKKLIDNRMAWVRNIEILQNGKTHSYGAEYEIASEVYIPGLLDYENGMILCGLMTFEKDYRGLYKYALKIRFATPEKLYNYRNARIKGYLFKEGIPGELLALLSLYFQCRFYILAAFSGDITQHGLRVKLEYDSIYRSCQPELDPTIFSRGNRNFASELSDFLNQVAHLDMEYHQQLILASYHYARALKEIGVDEEMVFIRLVAAIEAVSKWAKLQKGDDLFDGKEFKEIVRADLLSREEFTELKKLFEVRKPRKKFKRFIQQYSRGFFKGGKFKAPHTKIRKADLEKTLNAIYDSRSDYLHNGQAMYLSHPMRGGLKWDADPSLGMIIDRRKFPIRRKLPYGSFFQRLVRHCLLEFIKDISQ